MGLFDGNHTVNAITCSNVKQGPAGVGFKLTPSGDYDMENKKIFKLKTQADVKIDADYDSYALDLSSAVNKDYLKLNCLIKDAAGNDFDANQATINNSAPYYDGLYSENSLVSKKYVDLMDSNKADLSTKNEQTFNSIINVPNFDQGYSNMSNVMNKEYIDSRDALKADKIYTDSTFLTKQTGSILAQSLQSKADKLYANNTFLTKSVGNGLAQSIQNRLNIHGSNMMQANLDMNDNRITNLSKPIYGTDGVNKLYVDSSHITSIDKGNVFNNIMIDSDNQLSEENDIELGDLIDHPNPVHQINKKVIDTKLLLDSSKNYYSSRLGINMYPIPINYYTIAFELYFPVEIDENSVDISVVSLIDTVNKVTTRVYNGYSRTIAQVHKYQQHNNNYLYVDIVLKMKSGHSYVPKLQTYIIIYGIKNYESNVEPSIYDQLYYVENDRIAFNTSIDMKTQAIYGIAEGGIVSSISTGGISLVAISTIALLIQGWMHHQNLDLKIQNSTYAYQSYQHLLNSIKNMMRCGVYNPSSIIISMKNIDDYVADTGPIIDKYLRKYDKKFIG
ncbi:hypothetical protein ACROYT_G034420 [Oculina patagonica]